MYIKKFLLFFIACIVTNIAQANDTDELKNYLLTANSGSMSFSQEVINYEGDKAIANGSLIYQRPAKFRLQYSQPNQVLIVSNGDKIWVYDDELQQVIISNLYENDSAKGFLAVLATQNIDENFIISSFTDDNDIQWLVLSAKDPAAVNFNYAHINFDQQGKLATVLINDLLDNNILATFEHQNNFAINYDDFEFIVPDGIEIIQQ